MTVSILAAVSTTYAYHSGGPAVAGFSAQHDITGVGVWATALVLMAFGQVLARLGVLQIRGSRAISQPSARQHRIASVPQ